jgi:hypothetical protein
MLDRGTGMEREYGGIILIPFNGIQGMATDNYKKREANP